VNMLTVLLIIVVVAMLAGIGMRRRGSRNTR
jgi:hypothetical protein